jgi:serine/threonine protein kinase
MRHLSDEALLRLRKVAEVPDLSGTRYRLIGQVARGGMGIVYAAADEELHRRVALKILDISSSEGELANRLRREARVLARLEHPGIVPVHDVGTLADGRVFYTMKFVEGQRLDEYIGSVASLPDRLRIFLRICDAVAFAHARGVLHRDLKPSNVMVGSFGEVLVMDWGLAKIMAEEIETDLSAPDIAPPERLADMEDDPPLSALTRDGRVMGTPGYMSPEQATGEIELLDPRSDVFALGILLRFVIAEKLLGGSSRLDRSLGAICRKASAPDRDDRYAGVPELAADISRYLNGWAVTAHPESIFEKLLRFYRRYRFFILLLSAYLLMRVILIVALRH